MSRFCKNLPPFPKLTTGFYQQFSGEDPLRVPDNVTQKISWLDFPKKWCYPLKNK